MTGMAVPHAEELLRGAFAPWVQELDLRIEAVGADSATLRLPLSEKLTRIGGTVCGQALMALADTTMVFVISGAFGEFRPMTTVSQNTSFMKAISNADVIAEGRLLRLGKTLAFGAVSLRAEGDSKPAVEVTSTYAILQPPNIPSKG